MKLTRISAIWCSSCLIMRSRVNEIINDNNYDILMHELDYEDKEAIKLCNKLGLDIEILPIYIKENENYIIGEKTVKEVIKFLED